MLGSLLDQNGGNSRFQPLPSPELVHEREKLKLKLKDWETRFISKYNRQPTKSDVKQVPTVEQAYRRYTKLKKLTETGKDCAGAFAERNKGLPVPDQQDSTTSNDIRAADAIPNATHNTESPSAKRKRSTPARKLIESRPSYDDQDDDEVIEPTPVKRIRSIAVMSRLHHSDDGDRESFICSKSNSEQVLRAVVDNQQWETTSVFSRALNKLQSAVQLQKSQPQETDSDEEDEEKEESVSTIERLLQMQGIRKRGSLINHTSDTSTDSLPPPKPGSQFRALSKSSFFRPKASTGSSAISNDSVVAPNSLLHGAFKRYSSFSLGINMLNPHIDDPSAGDEIVSTRDHGDESLDTAEVHRDAEPEYEHSHDMEGLVSRSRVPNAEGSSDSDLSSVDDEDTDDYKEHQGKDQDENQQQQELVEEQISKLAPRPRRKRSSGKIMDSEDDEGSGSKHKSRTTNRISEPKENKSKGIKSSKPKAHVVPSKFARFNTRTRGRGGFRATRGIGRTGFRRNRSTSFAHQKR